MRAIEEQEPVYREVFAAHSMTHTNLNSAEGLWTQVLSWVGIAIPGFTWT